MIEKTKILGVAAETSQSGKKRLDIQSQVEAAMEKKDLAAVYSAYEKAVEDRCETEGVMMGLASTFLGKDKLVDNPFNAMRDVALAAIELAREVAGAKK